MRKIKALLSGLLILLPFIFYAQANYSIENTSVCGDTFSVEVDLEYTGLLAASQFGVYYKGDEVQLIDSTLLVSPQQTFVDRLEDSISFSLSFNPAQNFANSTPMVRLRFVRIDPAITQTTIFFKNERPIPLVTDGNNQTILAGTDNGVVSFSVFSYNDCPEDISTSSDPNQCGANVTWVPPTLNDCDGTGMEITPSQDPGDFFPVGTTELVYTAENDAGETTSCEFSITVNDVEAPSISCPADITVVANLDGTAEVNNIAPTDVSDNCDGNLAVTFGITGTTNRSGNDDASGSFNVGESTVSYTVTDEAGNQNSCSFTVTVEPNPNNDEVSINLAPSDAIACNDSTFILDVTVADSISLTTLQFSIGWDESIFEFGRVIPEGSPNPAGGGYAGLVNDSTLVTPGQMGYLFSDFSQPRKFNQNQLLFSIEFVILNNSATSVIGCTNNPNTLEASRDGDMLDVNCMEYTFQIAEDNEPPMVQFCPEDITAYANDNCMAIVSYPMPLFMDNCDGMDLMGTRTSGLSSGSSFSLGSTTIRYEYEDVGENGTAVCLFNVTVLDTISPSVTCMETTVYLDNNGEVTINSSDVISDLDDNCELVTVSEITPNTLNCSNLGQSSVSVTVSDNAMNTSSCTANITVLDTIAPIAVCQNISVDLNANGNALIADEAVNGGSTDNCSSLSFDTDITEFTCDDLGENTVVLTVTDESGNSSSCTAIVTVQDPSLFVECKDITVELDENGMATIAEDSIFLSGGKACEGATLSFDTDQTEFNCDNIGTNILTLTVEDTEGNTATCMATATVVESVSPVARCLSPVTVFLDDNGTVSIDSNFLDNGSSDNCAIDSFHTDITLFTCNELGNNTVTLTVFDASGNFDRCTSQVRVRDTIPPDASCRNLTVYLDDSGQAMIIPEDIDVNSADNCGSIDSLSLSDNAFDCNDVDINQSVFLYAFDQSGNRDSCLSSITVRDTIAPTISCPQNEVVFTSGSSEVVENIGPVSSGDNCNVAEISYDITGVTSGSGFDDASGTAFNVGISIVTYRIEDASGNIDSCSFTIEVQENPNEPFIDCPDMVGPFNNEPDRCDTVVNDIELFVFTPPGVSLDSITWTLIGSTNGSGMGDLSGTRFNVGTTRVTYTAHFDSDTTISCDFLITVNDVQAPVIVGGVNDTTLYSGEENCSVEYSWNDPLVEDNCPIDSLRYNIVGRPNNTSGTFEPGVDTIFYEISDLGGNEIDTFFVVTVLDTIAPRITCPSDTVIVVDPGVMDTVVNNLTWLAAFDNCDINNIYYSLSGATNRNSVIGDSIDASGERFNLGTTEVTYFITDDSGNIDSCSFNVTVTNFRFPEFSCPMDTIVAVDSNCMASIDTLPAIAALNEFDTIYHILRGAVVDTGEQFIGQRMFPVGTTNVTYYFGAGGQLDSCSFNIIARDTLPPLVECPPFTVTTINIPLSDSSVVVNNIAPEGISDNCGLGGAYYVLSGATNVVSDTTLSPDASGEIFNLGLTTVTYIGFDESGLADSCSFNVNILHRRVNLICPSDTVLFTNDSTCVALGNVFTPSFSDNNYEPDEFISILSGATTDTLMSFIDSSVVFNVGITNVEYISVNDNDTIRCDFNVEVRDTFSPELICQGNDTIVYFSFDSLYTYEGYSFNVSDNCGIDSSYYVVTRGDGTIVSNNTDSIQIELSRGVNEIKTFATDISGNTDSCSQFIYIIGFECPENQIINNSENECSGVLENVGLRFGPDSLITDLFYRISGDTNYVVNNMGLEDDASGDTLGVGNYELTYSIVSLNGDTSNCTTLIRVIDVDPPMFVNCPSDTVEVESNLDGCGFLFNIAPPSAMDNCGVDTIFGNIALGDTLPVGFTSVEYVVLDNNGRSDTCRFTIEVLERELDLICTDSIVVDVYGNIILDSLGLVDSINLLSCDESQIFFNSPQAFVNCIDSVAAISELSDFISGDTFSVGSNPVIFTIGDTTENLSCTIDFQVVIPDGPEILRDSLSLCEANSFLLESSVNDSLEYVYEWIFGDSLVSSSDSLFVLNASADQSGWYYLNSSTELGCNYIDSAFVSVRPAPISNLLSSYQGCLNTGDSLAICAIPLVEADTFIYQWITPIDTIFGDSCIIIDSVTASDIGTYTILIENELGCSFTDSIVVDTANSLEAPPIFVSDTTICSGTAISLGTSRYPFDSIEYVWSVDSFELSGLPENTDTFFFPSIVPQGDSVTYRLFVRTNEGCQSDTTALTIFIQDSPEINATTNAPIICATEADTLFLNGFQLDSLTSIETWVWNGPNGFVDSVQNSFIHPVNDTISGIYRLSGIAENGCIDETSVQVIVSDSFPAFELFAVADTICLGTEIQIFSSFDADEFSYDWMQSDSAGGLPIDSDSSSVVVLPTMPGDFSYSLVISQDSCISDTVSINIHVLDVPDLSVINNGPFLCLQGDTSLILQDTALEAVSYLWTSPDSTFYDSSFVRIDSIDIGDAGVYRVSAVGENGCLAMDSTEVIFLDSLAPSLITGDTIFCENDMITLSILDPLDGVMYDWSGPGGFVDSGAVVTIADAKVTNEGGYNVIASIENCNSPLSDTFFITDVLEGPIALDTSYTVSIDSSLMEILPIGNYNNSVMYDITILTEPEQGMVDISTGPEGLILTYTPFEDASGTDIISYTICPTDCPELCDAMNSQGTIDITILQSECIVNNLITPDGDDFNDFLIIDCLNGPSGSELFPDNELIILNQWGDEIYRAAPYQNDWDGTYEGDPVPDGTYYYLFREGPGIPLQKGFITVFR